MRRRTMIGALAGLGVVSLASARAQGVADIPMRFAEALSAHDIERFGSLFS